MLSSFASPLMRSAKLGARRTALVGKLAIGGSALVQRRYLSIHEYLSMDLLRKYEVPVPKSIPASTSEEAYEAAKKVQTKHGLVIKAQVLAGGRGKGHFDSGLQGGVHLVKTPEEARDYASKMLGNNLITKQTGAGGRICNMVMLAEARPPKHEYYVAVLNDRSTQLPVLIASNQGGMSIEDVARDTPDAIITTPIDFEKGLTHDVAHGIAEKLGFSGPKQTEQAADIFIKLYKLFKERDATQVEINPMAEAKDGEVMCYDAKLGFDDNAEFRQAEVFKLRDATQEDPAELEAAESGLNLINLDGDVACLVNGAGLAMATCDALVLSGGQPANFLDIGGAANEAGVKAALKIILRNKNVKSIFVNIFGGIVRADMVAEGVINAAKTMDIHVPLVVRLQGTNVEKATELINNFKGKVKLTSYIDLDEAATAAVNAAKTG